MVIGMMVEYALTLAIPCTHSKDHPWFSFDGPSRAFKSIQLQL